MNFNSSILTIDAGNTSIKIGEFHDGELLKSERYTLDEVNDMVKSNAKWASSKSIISSVLSEVETKSLLKLFPNSFLVDHNTPTEIPNKYRTIATLGIDRLCNASFAYKQQESEYTVIIDIGTCIKFDLVHSKKGYLGGSISPGIELRSKALNTYTGKLPLVSNKERSNLVGNDTNSSIQSGLMNGILAEIRGLMEEYRSHYINLTFFVTGGDAQYFDLLPKNDIFADENLTLKGLYEIYRYNH